MPTASDFLRTLEAAETGLQGGRTTLFTVTQALAPYINAYVQENHLSPSGVTDLMTITSNAYRDSLVAYAQKQIPYSAVVNARETYLQAIALSGKPAKPLKVIHPTPAKPPKQLRPLTRAEIDKRALDQAIAQKAPANTIANLQKQYEVSKAKDTTMSAKELALVTAPVWGVLALRWFRVI